MRYIPHTQQDVAAMLSAIGKPDVASLFSHIPETLRTKRPLDIAALDEAALLRHVSEIAGHSRPAMESLSFLGAGLTPHHIATAVDAQLARAEWYTSYTPYQPEISQGTLQAIFEFQTIVAELFGLDVANASMYDGASAAAEAVLMARRVTGKHRALLTPGLHPQYVETIETYLSGQRDHAAEEKKIEASGRVSLEQVKKDLDAHDDVACVVVQTPNYVGVVEDLAPIAKLAHQHGALLVAVTTEPLAFGVIVPPGSVGADICVGEGIGLATPPSLGGPGVGLFAAKQDLVRQMPGRLVGETVDKHGRRGYVLTLATREQHIRRDKATSNICTNQGLIALAFTIHMCLLGKRGLQELARINLAKSEYAKAQLERLRGFSLAYSGPTFNEFALRIRGGKPALVVEKLAARGIFVGVADGENLLIAVTERHTKADIDRLLEELDGACP